MLLSTFNHDLNKHNTAKQFCSHRLKFGLHWEFILSLQTKWRSSFLLKIWFSALSFFTVIHRYSMWGHLLSRLPILKSLPEQFLIRKLVIQMKVLVTPAMRFCRKTEQVGEGGNEMVASSPQSAPAKNNFTQNHKMLPLVRDVPIPVILVFTQPSPLYTAI